jgi:hypothetical protein
MASKIFPLILVAVVVWLGAQVWRDSSEGLRKAAEAGPERLALVPASARPPAADFSLVSSEGPSVQLASFRGKSPVVLNFFATW